MTDKEDSLRQEKTTPPSSSSEEGKTDDDEQIDLSFDWETSVGSKHAVEAARACFGDEVAALVEADAARIGDQINGRWDCYVAAVFLAKSVRRQPTRHLPYFLKTALGFIATGITAEAKAARDQVLEAARKKAESDRSFAEYLARVEAGDPREEARTAIESLASRGVGLRLKDENTVQFVSPEGTDFSPAPDILGFDEKQKLIRLKPEIIGLIQERDSLQASTFANEVVNA